VGGMRFNVYVSLLLATLNSLFIAAVYLCSHAFLKKKSFFKSTVFQIIAITVCLILLSFLITFLEIITSELFFKHFVNSFPEKAMRHIIFFRFVKNMVLTLAAFSAAQFNYSRIQEEKTAQMALEKEYIRLQFLKAQVNPHFLFNALNNIYALAYTKDDKAPDAVMKLADMLRHVIDMSNSDKVQLSREISYIRTYLDFHVMRLGEQADIRFEVDVDNPHQFIAPMILQPYIENCFNHGDISTNPQGYVHITLHVRDEKLKFTLSNTKGVAHYDLLNQQSKLGELNVEERLQFFYTDAFTLSIKEEDNLYNVILHIDLNRKTKDAKQ
jgi:LytS/YehU family sensor histidine kinase